jgi:diguanylate cyclase (GGDEF)-like protein
MTRDAKLRLTCPQRLMRLAAWRPPRLQFDDPALEARFHEARREARLRHYVISGFVALCIYNLFLGVDRMLVPDVAELAWRIRLLYFTPAALLLLAGVWIFKRDILRLPDGVIDLIVVMTGVLAGASLVLILAFSNSPLATTYYAGLIPIVVYGNLVQRFRFTHAALFSAFIGLMLVVRVGLGERPPGSYGMPMEISLVLLVMLVATYTLIMNYRMELEERRRFAGVDRAQILRARLEQSRQSHAALSRLDALTSLPNRRHFDEVLSQAWHDHRLADKSLALILLDVDHFKAFNDRYGHPAGDQCLKLVAQAMRSAVVGGGATLARWGGEEFIVLLPWATPDSATRLAQSLQQAVSALSLRHEASPTGARVSVSMGIKLMNPGESGRSIDQLISAADEALYQAKRLGRDRWEQHREAAAAHPPCTAQVE